MKPGEYQCDRRWSDQFIPAIRKIVGPHLLVESSFEVDSKQAADLVVLKARDMTIAARVRRFGYADKYPFEFTVRSARDSQAKTEMAKMLEGWADWMFYGHAAQYGSELDRWMLVDLHAWRERLLRAGYGAGWKQCATSKSNGDGTHFLAFDVRRFSPTIVIASGDNVTERST